MPYTLIIGQKYPRPLPPGMNGGIYEFDGSGHSLVVTFGDVTEEDVAQFERKGEFALLEAEGVIFLVWRFGSLTGDSPYNWHLQPEPMPEFAVEHHALISVVLVDRDTEVIRGLRAMTWSPEFTLAIENAIRLQATGPKIDPAEHVAAVGRAYRAYPDFAGMVAAASARCQGGS